jgi:ParB family chromosome partitioning protein
MSPARPAPAATAKTTARRKGTAAGRIGAVLADRASDALFGLSGALPKLVELDVGAVRPHPHQPRKRLDEAGIEELAGSIAQHGLLQPIVVRAEAGGAYALVAGQRRLEAFRRLGRERIPALIATGDGDELALVENLQRADLDPIDEAEALHALKERHGYTQDQLAKVLAKAKSTISELLALASLPDAIKAEARAAEPPPTKSLLIEVARLEGEAARLAFWQGLKARRGATVRAARAAKAGAARPAADPLRADAVRLLRRLEAAGTPPALDGELRPALEALHARLGALLGRA